MMLDGFTVRQQAFLVSHIGLQTLRLRFVLHYATVVYYNSHIKFKSNLHTFEYMYGDTQVWCQSVRAYSYLVHTSPKFLPYKASRLNKSNHFISIFEFELGLEKTTKLCFTLDYVTP